MSGAYARLRRAVLAYADALKRHAPFSSEWVEDSAELDELWSDVLAACEPDPESDEE